MNSPEAPPDPLARNSTNGDAVPAEELVLPLGRPLIPPDLDVPWDWRELLLFLLAAVAIALVAGYPILLVFQSLGISRTQIMQSPRETSYFLILNQIAWSACVMLFLWIRVRRFYGQPFSRTLGWRAVNLDGISPLLTYASCVGGGCTFAVLIEFAGTAVHEKTKLPIEAFFQDRRSAMLLLLLSVVVAPLVEETIFRGFIYPTLARSWGVRRSILATGTLFGLMHAFQLWKGWWEIALLVLVGIVFTWVRAVTRTVAASYCVHIGYNGLLFLGFVASGALRRLP
jgi:membrane protease YdiL (CAAX protease family)